MTQRSLSASEKLNNKLSFSETDQRAERVQKLMGPLKAASKDQVARICFRVGLAAIEAHLEAKR